MADITKAHTNSANSLRAVFVDLKAALDLAPGSMVLCILVYVGVLKNTRLIGCYTTGKVRIDNEVESSLFASCKPGPNNNLNFPFCSHSYLKPFFKITEGKNKVKVLISADDLLIYSPSRYQI